MTGGSRSCSTDPGGDVVCFLVSVFSAPWEEGPFFTVLARGDRMCVKILNGNL